LIAKAAPLAGASALVLAGTGPVGARAAAMLALEGADVTITGRNAEKTEAAAAAIGKRFGVTIKALAAPDAASRHAAVREAQILVSAGAAGHQLADASAWQESPAIRCVADLNPEPPLGLGGIGVSDKAKEYAGKIAFGALGIGGLKLKLHRACIGRLFTAHDQILDAEAILAIAKEMA
jgi:NAD(P)-dependent dehydrogenase (short-subunit alcohol dehydrogenase family)